MLEINKDNLNQVLPLFTDCKHHMSLLAASEGRAWARAWTDFPDMPSAAVICFGYRVLVGGNPMDSACRFQIGDYLSNTVLRNKVEQLEHSFMLFWSEPGWQDVLSGLLPGCRTIIADREYYGADLPGGIALPALPDAYELRPVDRSFLEEREWVNKDALQYEMCSERVNVEDFLTNSFGVCAVRDNEIAGWCLSEYNYSEGCEVGIEVREAHQRKGIGTALTLALMNRAAEMGLRHIGWSCFANNLPSGATARKAGLNKLADYRCIIVQR